MTDPAVEVVADDVHFESCSSGTARTMSVAKLPKAPEAILQEQLIGRIPDREGLAIRFGWEVLHIRAGRTQYGWAVPVTGSLGEGWPDLILVRPPRIVAAELKMDGKHATSDQLRVLDVLSRCGVETFVWHPADWDDIVKVITAAHEHSMGYWDGGETETCRGCRAVVR